MLNTAISKPLGADWDAPKRQTVYGPERTINPIEALGLMAAAGDRGWGYRRCRRARNPAGRFYERMDTNKP